MVMVKEGMLMLMLKDEEPFLPLYMEINNA